jgi:CheY-like chemotaxis protein
MDIQMPVMNGYEAIKKIREFNEDVIIITQSAIYHWWSWKKQLKLVAMDISRNQLIKQLIDHINKQVLVSRHKPN